MLSHFLKAVFGIVLLVSIVMPIYNIRSCMQIIAHNYYEDRFARLKSSGLSDTPSLFGLTASELAGLPRETAEAYEHAVRDGHRLGQGYSALWSQSMALNGLLFVSGILGLWSCRLRRQSPNQAMQRTAGSLDS
jgi:hypothetical protein